jgi:7-carboxy-7-deazaguanine synthase
MFGTNPIRKPEKGDGRALQVQEIFPTVQGEGPHTGVPSVFIRLGGCNLACTFCDTEFESFHEMRVDAILDEIEKIVAEDQEYLSLWERSASVSETGEGFSLTAHSPHPNPLPRGEGPRRLIVITGGEPFRQPIEHLCAELLAEGYRVQIETNGTLWRELPQAVEIICSPKAGAGGYYPLREDVLQRSLALKFIISAHQPFYNVVPELGQGTTQPPVFVQPMDEYDAEKNRANLELTLHLAQTHGYKVSLQTHKLAGID